MKTTAPPTKWARLVAGLIAKGLTQEAIAKACDSKASTVRSLRSGTTKEPGHALGESLLKLGSAHDLKV